MSDQSRLYGQLGCFAGINLNLLNEWQVDDFGYLIFIFNGGYLWVEPRPPHCQRCNWVARVDVEDPMKFSVSDADPWPRPYFDLRVAIHELESWLLSFERIPQRTNADIKGLLIQSRTATQFNDLFDTQLIGGDLIRTADVDVLLNRSPASS